MSSMFSISGLASGLDTDTMVTSLMQIERMPVVRMKSRQTTLRRVDDAWAKVTTRLSAVREAVDTVANGTRLAERWQTTSSNTSAVAASVTGTAQPGSTTFTVDRLATAMAASSTGTSITFASADEVLAAGTFTLEDADGASIVSVTTDGTSTTLADLAAQLDAAPGVRASVVRAGTDDFRLVLTGEQTGTSGNFSIDSDVAGLATGDFDVTAGQDALITFGNLQVARSSNTVTDLIDGVSLTLQGQGQTTVTVARDVDSSAKDITAMVDAVNAALGELAALSKYDPESRVGGPLTGDGTTRRLVDQLRRGLADTFGTLDGSAYPTAGSIGISMTREGTFTVDEAQLKSALETDPAAVDRLISRGAAVTDASGTTVPGITFQSATRDTEAGDHEVVISQLARVARATGAAFTPPLTDPETFTITAAGGTQVEVTIGVGESVTSAVTKINQALRDAEVDTITATDDGAGGIELAESRYGTGYDFTVSANTLGIGTTFEPGQDVAGTIDGVTAAGAGRRLSLPTTADSAAAGLALMVDPGAGATTGTATATVTHGLAGRMDQILRTFEGSTGAIALAQEGISSRIEVFQDRIDGFEVRLEQRERALRRQFTAMESALSQMQSQGNWLAGQLGGLMANNGQG